MTFSLMYAFSEQFVLPISHDEVVHGKGSLWSKIPGDEWQKAATLRTFLAHQWAHPGKQLLFMGQELGNPWEWNQAIQLPWQLKDYPLHNGVRTLVGDLNRVYRDEPGAVLAGLHARPGSPGWTPTTATATCWPTCAGAATGR